MTITAETPKKFTLADKIFFALDIVSHVIVWGVGIAMAMAAVGVFAWAYWNVLYMSFGDYQIWALVGSIILIAAAVRVTYRR